MPVGLQIAFLDRCEPFRVIFVCREAQAVNYLFDMIAANPAKFPESKSPYQYNEIWGKPRGEYTAVIGTVFDKLMRDGGYDPRAVLSYASRQGLLQEDQKQHRKNIRIDKNVSRCVVIKQPPEMNTTNESEDND